MKKNEKQELLNQIYDLKYYERELRKNYLNAQNEVVKAITSSLEEILRIKGKITQEDILEIRKAWLKGEENEDT